MDRETRLEENEKLFREVNERVEQMQDGLLGTDPQWVCECGDRLDNAYRCLCCGTCFAPSVTGGLMRLSGCVPSPPGR